MKKIDVSRLEHWRAINLKIGFAASLAFALLAFNWTTEREIYTDPYTDFAPVADLEVIPQTTRPKRQSPPPPPKPSIAELKIMTAPVAFTPINPGITEPVTDPGPAVFTGPAAKTYAPTPKPKEEEPKVDEIFIIVEEMPRFPGCEETGLSKKEKAACAEGELLQYLATSLRYPAIARENGIEGMVVVSFVVETDGSITGAKVVRDIGGGCGAEALRAVRQMPEWIAGKQRGRAVRVQFNLPVKFKLS